MFDCLFLSNMCYIGITEGTERVELLKFIILSNNGSRFLIFISTFIRTNKENKPTLWFVINTTY